MWIAVLWVAVFEGHSFVGRGFSRDINLDRQQGASAPEEIPTPECHPD
jgi:hypothetical protein